MISNNYYICIKAKGMLILKATNISHWIYTK